MEANIQNQLTILLWVIGGGFGVTFGLMAMMWNNMNSRFDKVDERFGKVDDRFDRIETRLTRIENDMIEIKTILRLKEGCVIKDSSQLRKAE